LYDDHRIATIEEFGKQCEADASRVIHASRFDATLSITRELLAKYLVLGANREEQDDQPQDVRGYSDNRSRQLQHLFIMPESARVYGHPTRSQPARAHNCEPLAYHQVTVGGAVTARRVVRLPSSVARDSSWTVSFAAGGLMS
jgi:hypothetical protein